MRSIADAANYRRHTTEEGLLPCPCCGFEMELGEIVECPGCGEAVCEDCFDSRWDYLCQNCKELGGP